MQTLSAASLGLTLLSWTNPPVDLYEPVGDPLLDRIRQVMVEVCEQPGRPCPNDLMPLVRQWLLRPDAGSRRWLTFPRSDPWPARADWRDAGFEVAEMRDRLEVAAVLPRLSFLGPQADLFDDAFAGVPSPRPEPEPADPFFAELLGTTHYTGAAQREAVRALVGMAAGETLVADLPTGGGKSVLAQLPVLLGSPGSLVVVIVPTIALAMDQSDRMLELLRRRTGAAPEVPLAYHGGLPPDTRRAIRQALRDGNLPVIFTSPEAATSSLRDEIAAAAAAGRLSHLIVDEAHLVAAWGGAFRPAFQLLPALARDLRSRVPDPQAASPRIVLASATLTPDVVAFLREQFEGPAGGSVVAGIHLRGEPRYAMYRATDETERTARLLEAVRAAPRPVIIYTTRPEEAEDIAARLRADGHGRTGCFTGRTPAEQRHSLLRAWRDNRVDCMVATSAFGVGIDKTDVRTVIHATFPESLDRFYQEVGRGGRDGLASASLMLYTGADVEQARELGSTVFIGNDLGLERWTAMLQSRQTRRTGDGDTEVDIDALRPELFAHSRRNRLWNLRTLTLMATAGLVELRSVGGEPAGAADDDAGDLDADAVRRVRLRITGAGHERPEVFAERTSGVRSASWNASRRGLQLMQAAAAGQQPVEAVLTELYTLSDRGTWAPVAPVCGGCPAHWTGRAAGTGQIVRPWVNGPVRMTPRADPAAAVAGLPPAFERVRVISCTPAAAKDDAQFGRLLRLLTTRLLPHTIIEGPGAAAAADTVRRVAREAPAPLMIDAADLRIGGTEGEVRVAVWLDSPLTQAAAGSLMFSACAMTILLIDPATPDPFHPTRAMLDTIAHVDLQTALRMLA